MRSNADLQKKLHGFHGIGRGILLLLHNRTLTTTEFLLYFASLIIATWDKDKKNSYGVIEITQEEIETIMHVSAGYVSKHKEKLIKSGFWRVTSSEKIEVIGFELIETSLLSKITKDNKIVDYQKYIAHKQTEFAAEQKVFAPEQTTLSKAIVLYQPQTFAVEQTKPPISDLVSYKNSSSIMKSEEEYKTIKEENIFSFLTIEDMKCIDLNVHETPNVHS